MHQIHWMTVRRALPRDHERLSRLRSALWLETTDGGERRQTRAWTEGRMRDARPGITFVAEVDGVVVGFMDAGVRSHADGCDPVHPAGYIEGWYVEPPHRGVRLGDQLLRAVERWCRQQGCAELGSDTALANEVAQRAHVALGFQEVDRCVRYRKALGGAATDPVPYGDVLAAIHHHQFGMIAEGAAEVLIRRLHGVGIRRGTVVDLAAGTGILSRRLEEAGYDVLGVDISESMLRIAREHAPGARFIKESLWRTELPPCVAVAAVGEALGYAADPVAGMGALRGLLTRIHDALCPGGLLVFDVPGPGRSGTGGIRRACWSEGESTVTLIEQEDRERLIRDITVFVPFGSLARIVRETHTLRVFEPKAVEALMRESGFEASRLGGYGNVEFRGGWAAFLGQKEG